MDMKCLGGHMECLCGTRLQSFLTLFTRATPGTPASYYYEHNWVYRRYNMTITWLLLIRIYLYNNNAPCT